VSAQPSDPALRGLLDTSVVISLERVTPDQLPNEPAIAAMTLAELAAGPHATDDDDERARRQDRLQRVEAALDPLPFDAAAARAYGRIYAATRTRRRKPRGARAVDLMIAAVALANDLPLFTCNPDDVEHLEQIGLDLHVVERVAS
jgi:predicted nucleic acid-binding protein